MPGSIALSSDVWSTAFLHDGEFLLVVEGLTLRVYESESLDEVASMQLWPRTVSRCLRVNERDPTSVYVEDRAYAHDMKLSRIDFDRVTREFTTTRDFFTTTRCVTSTIFKCLELRDDGYYSVHTHTGAAKYLPLIPVDTTHVMHVTDGELLIMETPFRPYVYSTATQQVVHVPAQHSIISFDGPDIIVVDPTSVSFVSSGGGVENRSHLRNTQPTYVRINGKQLMIGDEKGLEVQDYETGHVRQLFDAARHAFTRISRRFVCYEAKRGALTVEGVRSFFEDRILIVVRSRFSKFFDADGDRFLVSIVASFFFRIHN